MGQSSLPQKHACWVCCSAATCGPDPVLHLHRSLRTLTSEHPILIPLIKLGKWELGKMTIWLAQTKLLLRQRVVDPQCSTCCLIQQSPPPDNISLPSLYGACDSQWSLSILRRIIWRYFQRVWWNLFLFFVFLKFAEASFQNESHTHTHTHTQARLKLQPVSDTESATQRNTHTHTAYVQPLHLLTNRSGVSECFIFRMVTLCKPER